MFRKNSLYCYKIDTDVSLCGEVVTLLPAEWVTPGSKPVCNPYEIYKQIMEMKVLGPITT